MIAQKVREEGSTQQVRAGQTDRRTAGGKQSQELIGMKMNVGEGERRWSVIGECAGTALEVKASGG